MEQSEKRIVLMASGSGSNAENIANYFSRMERGATVAAVLCNNPSAGVLERCKRLGLPSYTFNKAAYGNPGSLLALLEYLHTDLIVLAGFLWKIPADFIQRYPGRIINIHPALLPRFGGKGMYGMHVHEAVSAAGERETGISIHHVNEAYDEGDMIAQFRVPVPKGATADEIAGLVHELEMMHYPRVIEKLLDEIPAH